MTTESKTNIDKLLKDFTKLGIKKASEATEFGFLDTPFASVNRMIGGIPIGRFTTVAG